MHAVAVVRSILERLRQTRAGTVDAAIIKQQADVISKQWSTTVLIVCMHASTGLCNSGCEVCTTASLRPHVNCVLKFTYVVVDMMWVRVTSRGSACGSSVVLIKTSYVFYIAMYCCTFVEQQHGVAYVCCRGVLAIASQHSRWGCGVVHGKASFDFLRF